jgi:hypothetical protein
VTCYYAEKSSSNYIYAPLSTTLGDLRDQIHTKVKSTLEVNWGERDAIHPEPASILISGSKKEAFSLQMHNLQPLPPHEKRAQTTPENALFGPSSEYFINLFSYLLILTYTVLHIYIGFNQRSTGQGARWRALMTKTGPR